MTGIDFDSWSDYVPAKKSIDIDQLARQAISRIKSNWELPKSGFIAGGAVANIIWEMVSGNKAVINDIDVFIYGGVLTPGEANEITSSGRKLSYVDKDLTWQEDYNGITFAATPTDYYLIESVSKDEIYNYVNYRATKSDPSLVIKSFDINCTSVGYSIDEDKVYWLKSFEDFLETGELRVTTLTTPCHTAIRMCKKQEDLNAKLDSFEYDIIDYAIRCRFSDTNKTKFSTRYHDLFEKYKGKLSSYFIEKQANVEEYLKTKGIDIELFTLHPKDNSQVFDISTSLNNRLNRFNDTNLNKIYNSKHFLFYMRNIYRNERLKSIWEKTSYFFTNEDYIDVTIVDDKSLDILSKITQFAPSTIENLKGHRLSKQLDFISRLFDKFKDDPLVGISLLEKYKINDIDLDDDKSLLILELTVRKSIAQNNTTKVDKILDRREEKFSEIDNLPDFSL